MSKAKFEAAKELIQAGKHQQARVLLETIDHPKAKEWIAKIDARTMKPKRSITKTLMIIAAVLILAALFVFAGVQWGIGQMNANATTGAYVARMRACEIYTDTKQFNDCLNAVATP